MDKASTQLHDLLQKEISRQEFLQTLGVGLVSVLGLGALLKLAGYKGHNHLGSGRGYGSSPYGI